MLYKRSSIFFISFIYCVNAFGLCMVYFITFSDIMASFVRDIMGKDEVDMNTFESWLCEIKFWVLVLAVFMLPICLKKELQELHIVSITLFIAILTFIFIIFLQLCIFGTGEFSFIKPEIGPDAYVEAVPITFNTFLKPYVKGDFYTWVKAICCQLVAFSFTQNLFPVFSALAVKTNENC